ncbi:MAG TPA: dihydrofolate reductase family protein [Gaiellaceae bacterium]
MRPLELLYEVDGLAHAELPAALAALYPGALGFEEPRLFANFVTTVDGVVAIPSVPGSNKLIAAASESDRFVMGLLRACADALVIGSGTLAASPRGVWTAEQAYPGASEAYAELRRLLGREPELEVVVLSASGAVDPDHPAFAAGAIVLTTDEGAAALDGSLPAASVLSVGPGPRLDVAAAVELLRSRGRGLILSEGGPHVLGSLLEAGLVDELFLTLSPLLVGRRGGDDRLALVEGADLLPGGPAGARLLSVRREAGHLFLRYELDRSRDQATAASASSIQSVR